MRQDTSQQAFPHAMQLYCVIDMRCGELICNIEAADSSQAVFRASSVAGLLGKSVAMRDLAAAPVDSEVSEVPTFNDLFFVQESLFSSPPEGTTFH